MKENWPRQLSENLGTEWIKQPLQTNHKSTTQQQTDLDACEDNLYST